MTEEMDMEAFKEVFLAEAREHLQSLNEALLKLESEPNNTKLVDQVFRVAHTLKGMSATMGYEKITELSHKMEDYLENFRKGKSAFAGDSVELMFECLDVISAMVNGIEKGNDVKPAGIEKLILRLASSLELETVKAASDDEITTKSSGGATQDLIRKTIRVNVTHLDTLMDLAGELVINKSHLEDIALKHRISELQDALAQFSRVGTQLQEAVLKTRMVPISHIFERYPRMVRDLAKKLKKDVEFLMTGTDIEIDRLLLEEINEPLVHLLRNALDHGLELAQDRMAKGKKQRCLLRLTAKREKEMVVIEVADDGRGMDAEEIKAHAVGKGILSKDGAAALSDSDAIYLICDPQFSTAKEVSDISGRGVGLDVVKVTVEAFNGRLDIRSKKGVGSAFTIKLPSSLAIAPALLVKVKEETYALPLNQIREIVAATAEELHVVGNREMMVLRGSVLPLTRLDSVLDVSGDANNAKSINVVVAEVDDKFIGLVVSSFLGRKEIVVKTLEGILRSARGFTGATILGDGSVVPILDIAAWV